MDNSTQQSETDGGQPSGERLGSTVFITWECNECQQIGATYCCRVAVDYEHGDNVAIVCPDRCPFFPWTTPDWYRVSDAANTGAGRR